MIKKLLSIQVVLLILGLYVGGGPHSVCHAQDELRTLTLSVEELEALRSRIFSRSTDYSKRVQIASTLTRLFEMTNRPRLARRLCLDFYDSIAAVLEDAPPQNQWGEPYDRFADAIDRGKRRETIGAMDALVQNASAETLAPCLTVLALKADYMTLSYQILFNDFSDQKITPNSLYVLGLLAAREKRFIEGERFMARARGKLDAPILERWLSIDLAKLSIVNNKIDEARAIVRDILAKNPKDPHALNIMIFSHVKNKKDLARQQLSQTIDLLYPDPYLIAETAKLAIQLMELDTAARILERYEPTVEPNREFYEVFSFVRRNQGKQHEADGYAEKARLVHDSRVAVSGVEPLSHELREAVDRQTEQQQNTEMLEGVDALSKAYYYLLDEDYDSAIAILQNEKKYPYEFFVLAAIQRRIGLLRDAVESIQQIKTSFPEFRPHEILALLADLNVRLDAPQSVVQFYKDIVERSPDSYQADVARKALSQPERLDSNRIVLPVQVSSRMSRYSNYDAPFILTEIREHWGDPASFATFTNLLRVSPRRRLLFHEFVTVLSSITRHRVIPFTGDRESVLECLELEVPVVFCQGDMFDNQTIAELELIAGADPQRDLFYAEGITPMDRRFMTENELLEGICFAVYPSSLEPQWTPDVRQAIERGKEFIKLHMEASHIQVDPDYDATEFLRRQQTILEEPNPAYLPHKLAFARWTIRHKPNVIAAQYLSALRESCTGSADFWFVQAVFYSNQKDANQADAFLEKAIKRRPEYPRYILARVRMLDQMGKTNEAINLAERLRDQFPENTFVSSQILLLYKKTDNRNKAKLEEERLKKLLNVEEITIDSNQE